MIGMLPTQLEEEYESCGAWRESPDGVDYSFVTDVAVDSDGLVFLLTRGPGQVLVHRSDGSFVRAFGLGVLGGDPHGITAADGVVWIADQHAHVLRSFTVDGEPIAVWGTPGVASDTGLEPGITELFTRTASIRHSAGPFHTPANMHVADDGEVYVADGYGNTRVHRFSPSGELVGSWGDPGPGPGQFWIVHHVSVTADGRVLVVDRGNERIQVFDRDGRYLDAWHDVQHPSATVPQSDGTVLVGELAWTVGAGSFARGRIRRAEPARITRLAGDGTVLSRSRGDETTPFRFVSPHGLATSSSGDLYVADLRITPPMEPDTLMVHKFTRRPA